MSNLGAEYFVKGEWKVMNDIQGKSTSVLETLSGITYVTYNST
jgi:hypothetical protein